MDPDGAGPGIITERDILTSLGAGQDPDAELVSRHLTSDVVYAHPTGRSRRRRPRWCAAASAI